MMKVGVHASALLNKRTGVENYLYYLVREWRDFKDLEMIFYLPDSVSSNIFFSKNKKSVSLETIILKFPFLWTQIRLSCHLLRHKPDILFIPAHILPRVKAKINVVTIHGLEFEFLPKFYSYWRRQYLRVFTKEAVRKADAIIAVSENTKKDLINLYNASEEKITVIHHGLNLPPQKFLSVEEKIKPYILYLGRLESKKNIDIIIQAFERIKKQIPGLKLVLAGSKGFGYNSSWRANKDIIETGYVSEERKWSLLNNAEIFVFPTLYEGFGMPVLEAQVVSTPVIISNVSSLPEIAGKGAFFVNPKSPDEIADGILAIISDMNLRKDLIARGLANVKRFSWQKCARETIEVFKTVYGK